MSNYINEGFERCKTFLMSMSNEKIHIGVEKISKVFEEYNKNKMKYTEQYITLMENSFNSFYIEAVVYPEHGGNKRVIVGQENYEHEQAEIEKRIEGFTSKLEALKYLSFLSFEKKNVVMVGANGCGKTTLLRYLIKNIGEKDIAYYPADRLFIVNSNYNPERDYDAFIKNLKHTTQQATNIENDVQGNYINQQFDKAIALFEKQRAIDLADFSNGLIDLKDSITSIILNKWEELVMDRRLYFRGALKAQTLSGEKYELKYLSSGEKNIFYFLTYVLIGEEKKYYFVDEPENNLNPSIINKLWDFIEKKRHNSIFVYLTHNNEFATSRVNTNTYWIKKYNGNNIWEFEKLPVSDTLPKSLLISLVGNKRTVLFCESENDEKYDSLLFNILFPEFKVIPSGGCDKVQTKVKAYKELNLPSSVYGIIDCDYKDDNYLNGLERKNVYHLPTFEIENFYLMSDIIVPFLQAYSTNPNAFDLVKAEVKSLYEKNIEKMIVRKIGNELHSKSYNLGINNLQNSAELVSKYNQFVNSINVNDMINTTTNFYNTIKNCNDYDSYLRYLDCKGIISLIEPKMSLRDGITYEDEIISFLKNNENLVCMIKNKYFSNIK